MTRSHPRSTAGYAAKLLFQFRVVTDGVSDTRRLCEERIVLIEAASAKAALTEAKRVGREARFSYRNDFGGIVLFEFVGVLDLLELGLECGPNEVWYDMKYRLTPMERREKLIPPERELSAIALERAARAAGTASKRKSRGRARRSAARKGGT